MSGIKNKSPIPGGQHLPKILATNMQAPLQGVSSGELTASVRGAVMAGASVTGKITGAWLSVGQRGVDASNDLYVEADVLINGTTVFTTKPRITQKSGGGQASSIASGEGIIQAVVNPSANSVSFGDTISYDLELTRTASPTTEMNTLAIVVDLEPDID